MTGCVEYSQLIRERSNDRSKEKTRTEAGDEKYFDLVLGHAIRLVQNVHMGTL